MRESWQVQTVGSTGVLAACCSSNGLEELPLQDDLQRIVGILGVWVTFSLCGLALFANLIFIFIIRDVAYLGRLSLLGLSFSFIITRSRIDPVDLVELLLVLGT